MRNFLPAPLAAVTILSIGVQAYAGNKPLAEQLFRKAQTIMQSTPTREELHQACMLYKESLDNDAAINTQVALAACYEKEGKNVSAWGLYTDVSSGGGAAAQYAKEHADAIYAKGFLKVRFETKGLPSGAKVTLDGQPIGMAAMTTGIDADPGEHTVVVKLEGAKDVETKFDLTTPKSPLTVALSAGTNEKPETIQPTAQPKDSASPAMVASSSGVKEAPAGQRTTGGGVRIAGIVLTIVGGIVIIPTVALFAGSKDSKELPAPIALAVVDVALITTGIIMIAVGGSKPAATTSWQLSPVIGSAGGGAILRHSF